GLKVKFQWNASKNRMIDMVSFRNECPLGAHRNFVTALEGFQQQLVLGYPCKQQRPIPRAGFRIGNLVGWPRVPPIGMCGLYESLRYDISNFLGRFPFGPI